MALGGFMEDLSQHVKTITNGHKVQMEVATIK